MKINVPCHACKGKFIQLTIKNGMASTRTIDKKELNFEQRLIHDIENIYIQNC